MDMNTIFCILSLLTFWIAFNFSIVYPLELLDIIDEFLNPLEFYIFYF